MADISINQIKAQLSGGGARPCLFEVELSPPAGIGGAFELRTQKFTFLCQGASLPEQKMSVINVPFQGRQIKVAGNRTFDPWTIKVINDEDFNLRNAFEIWNNALNAHVANIRTGGATSNPSTYKGDARVRQISKEGFYIKSYQMVGVWPSDVAAIALDWSTTDAIETFDITLQYDYWTVDASAENGSVSSTTLQALANALNSLGAVS